ncbi:MAG: hypothetical protein IPL62_09925 [Caulobacteraceae bacterium]|jgi:hypothetical protein|nr:hypothetical protein [Caulobacteraceae bacterium]MBK8543840.1 hypothetical protein [Caulobacteraceae bacterium]MBP6690015.1 hypothetical protein [Hyphomonadaceae bacterium]
MRGFLIAAVTLAACSAPVAHAQSSDAFEGTWTFQTASYGNEQVGGIMSGAAVITREAPNRYAVRLIANERLVNRDTGQGAFLTARQNCTGANDEGQFTITCQMAEPLEGYEPDTFVLQAGETDQLVGVQRSQTSPQVTFSRMR